MKHIIGLMAMIFGFIGFAIHNIDAAHLCFGFAFILWCAIAIDEYVEYKKRKKLVEESDKFFDYKIPEEIKERFTKEFLTDFYNELDRLFHDTFDMTSIKHMVFATGTYGWNDAFKETCEKHSMSDIVEYYDNLEWYESDSFDDQLVSLMNDNGLFKNEKE